MIVHSEYDSEPNPTSPTWRPVLWPTGYEVSDNGTIRSLKGSSPRIMTPRVNHNGHLRVALRGGAKGARRRYTWVHELVLEAFVSPRPEGCVTRHLDGDPTNNHIDNLAWGTVTENNRDTVRHGTHWWASLTHCKHGHAFDEANTHHYRDRRVCRECGRLRQHALSKASR